MPFSHTISRLDVRRGDHIYYYYDAIPKKERSQHGIFVGDPDNSVIYLSGERVVRCTMADFLTGKDVKLFRYGEDHAQHALKKPFLGMTSLCPSNPIEQVVQVANWFYTHERDFSKHWPGVCHSQAFATFCKTTKLNKATLNQARGSLPDLMRREFENGASPASGQGASGLVGSVLDRVLPGHGRPPPSATDYLPSSGSRQQQGQGSASGRRSFSVSIAVQANV